MTADHVTIVSGLPRSGTSLMMQMLQAGGLPLLTDGQRAPDEHNPRGYFELEKVKHSRADVSWLEQAVGKAVKVIHLLLLQLPAGWNYRVIFLRRDIEEVVASQRTMLQQQGHIPAKLDSAALASIFAKQLGMVEQWLHERPHFQVLYVNHRDVISQPAITAETISHFLGGNLRVSSMAEVVNPALYRQRKAAP